jgi:uncharacterized protein (TIGR00255 family)
MIRSMTGYSRIQHVEGHYTITVGVKSTNHRFLDLQIRLSPGLEAFEPALRNLVKKHVARGHIELQVSLERAGPAELRLDRRLLDAYLATLQKLRQDLCFTSDPDLVALLRIPGMVAVGNDDISAEDLERLRTTLERVAEQALTRLNEMRAREGEALERDLRSRLERLTALAEQVDRRAKDVPILYRNRLERRLQEMLASSGRAELDAVRVAQEVAFLASRSDIAEELTRFRSHLDQIGRLLSEGPEVGKKMDFLLQEMNREANTLLSKTTDIPEVGLEITQQAIEMKAEIEKLREQAQNLE